MDNLELYHGDCILDFPSVSRHHSLRPSQKPVELLAYMIETYSQLGQVVLDYCMGSGSSGVACQQVGRAFVGIEKGAHYFDVAKCRIDLAVRYPNLFEEGSCQN